MSLNYFQFPILSKAWCYRYVNILIPSMISIWLNIALTSAIERGHYLDPGRLQLLLVRFFCCDTAAKVPTNATSDGRLWLIELFREGADATLLFINRVRWLYSVTNRRCYELKRWHLLLGITCHYMGGNRKGTFCVRNDGPALRLECRKVSIHIVIRQWWLLLLNNVEMAWLVFFSSECAPCFHELNLQDLTQIYRWTIWLLCVLRKFLLAGGFAKLKGLCLTLSSALV